MKTKDEILRVLGKLHPADEQHMGASEWQGSSHQYSQMLCIIATVLADDKLRDAVALNCTSPNAAIEAIDAYLIAVLDEIYRLRWDHSESGLKARATDKPPEQIRSLSAADRNAIQRAAGLPETDFSRPVQQNHKGEGVYTDSLTWWDKASERFWRFMGL